MTAQSRPTTAGITRAIRDQLAWIARCGGDEAGYIARYGDSGDGGAAIYAADAAQLVKLIGQAQEATGPVTVATMLMASAEHSVYGVYRAKLRIRRGQRWWDLNAATTAQVGVVRIPRGVSTLTANAMLADELRQRATPDAPAFDFQGGFILEP